MKRLIQKLSGRFILFVLTVAAAINGPLAHADCTPPPSGLVAWWPGEGNANDVIGGNNGILMNGLGFATGEVGRAFNFDGAYNYILVNATPTLNVGLGAGLTFEGWIYPRSLATEQLIFEFENNLGTFNAADSGCNCSLHPDKPGALYANLGGVDGSSHELLSPYNILVPNAWQHIAITYDKASGVAALYLNGSAVLVTNIGSFTPQTSHPHLVMGARTTYNSVTYPGDGVNGMMDEICFYSRALSSDEIAAIYNAGNAGKCSVTGPVAPVITSQPASLSVLVSNTASFTVTATGTAPLSYQWSLGTTPLTDETNATLVLPNVQFAQAGNYSVQISNSAGSTNSDAAVLTVTAPPSCTPPPSGLAAWWPAEGNGNDIIGGNNGILMNGLSFAPGEVGQAFNFDGAYNYILVNATPTLNVGLGSGLTFEGWIYPNSLSQEELIFEFENNLGSYDGNDAGINCSFHPDKPGAIYSNLVGVDRTSHELVSPYNIVVPNAWQHIAITYDKASGVAALYLNGSAVLVTNIGSFTPETSFPHLVMGARTTYNSVTYPGDGVDGMMDELSFYSRALSSDEIAAIYNSGSAGKCSTISPIAPVITSQPASLSVIVSNTATFTVAATGTAPLSYQWSLGTTPLTDETNATLVLPNVQFAQAGNYSVQISNSAGSTNSDAAVLTVLAPPPPGSCTPPPSGLVAWWPGEGNANDIVGGNNGILMNGLGFASGEVGHAFNFNGNNNYILVNTTPDLNVGLGAGLTFEGWIYPISLAGEQLIFEFESNLGTYDGNDTGINCSLHPDKPGAIYSNLVGVDRTSHELLSPYNLIVPNAWQHIAITYDKASGVAALYLNGSAVLVTNIGSFTPETSPSHLVMGARTTFNSVSNPGDGVDGMMDELCFYSRALSSDEIAAIYNAGSAGKCTGTIIPPAIISQPADVTVTASNTATFVVFATGTAPLAYQWSFGNTPLTGETNSTLVLPNVQLAQAGNYSVLITNSAGSTNSVPAVLTVTVPPPPPPPPTCTPPPSGLVAWWPGEGNANDVVGGNDAILMNATLSTNNGTGPGSTNGPAGPAYTNVLTGLAFDNGEVGQAFNFNGYDNYLLVHATPNLDVGAGGGLTFEGWIYLKSLAQEQLIFEFENNLGTYNGADAGFNCSLHPDMPGALYANLAGVDGTSHEILSPLHSIVANMWQHIAITYDKTSGGAALYINGAQVADVNFGSFTPQTSFTNLVMGARTTFNSVAYPGDAVWGLMDELSFYSRALSADEIAAIYNAGSAGKCAQVAPLVRPSVVVAPPPLPALALTGAKGSLQLAWPAGSGSFHVQAAVTPAGPWTTLSLPLITNGDNATIMVSPTNQQVFFRLVAP